MSNYKIHLLNILKDNYCWIISEGNNAVIIDAGESEPILKFLDTRKLNISAILLTHYHNDHVGGLKDIIAKRSEKFELYGSKNPIMQSVNVVKDEQVIKIGGTSLNFKVLTTPGHSEYCTSFLLETDDKKHLFCGDTLFEGGCGRIISGTYEEMFDSLEKIKSLAPETKVYCGHNYIESNLKFAQTIEPDNSDIKNRLNGLKPKISASDVPTLETELKTNPFIRCTTFDGFTRIREQKDKW